VHVVTDCILFEQILFAFKCQRNPKVTSFIDLKLYRREESKLIRQV